MGMGSLLCEYRLPPVTCLDIGLGICDRYYADAIRNSLLFIAAL